MSTQSVDMASSVLPPQQVWAQAVDVTSRAYDISAAALTPTGDSFTPGMAQRVYITIQADGAAVYCALDTASRTIAHGTAVAAGETPAYADAHCCVIPDGQERSFLVKRSVHKYLMLKTASGTATARIYFSSPAS